MEEQLFTRCSLLVEIHSLLVTCCKITRYLLKNVLVTRCRSCSLQEIARYSLQNSLVTRCRSCSLQKITRYLLQNSLVTRCRSCSLQKITRYLLQNLLVTRCRSVVTFCNFMKKKIHRRCFPVKYWKTLGTPILRKIKERLLVKIITTFTVFYVKFFTLIWFKFDWIVLDCLIKLN